MVFCKEDNKNKCNNAFKALVLNVTANDNFKKQDSDCFLITFGTLSANKAAFVSAELANKACAHLLTTPTNATDTATEACTHLLTTPTNATDTATEACTHLLTTPTNTTDPVTEADLFVYSTTAKSRYTSTVFIGIMVNISVSKKSTADYRQF
jgi:hypothetical protein